MKEEEVLLSLLLFGFTNAKFNCRKWKKFVYTIQLICRRENWETTPEFCFISVIATQFLHYFPQGT